MMWRTIILINILLGFHVTFCDIVDKTGLKAVVVLYRHGDRSPIFSYPKDPYFDKQYWPMGFGQLLNQGKRRHYNLGKWLRETYKGFLPEIYSPEDIYVFSTDIDRTLMSAAANLAGLYPPKITQTWDNELKWQPTSIHTAPQDFDLILQSPRNCPKYQKLVDEISKSEFFTEINKKYSSFYDQLSAYTGWDVDSTRYIAILQETLDGYKIFNSSFMPPWYDNFNATEIQYLAALDNTKPTFTPELAKLSGGVLFHTIFEYFESVIEGNTTRKMVMFSGHESTITRALNLMHVFNNKIPPFASMVIWELYNKDGRYYINLLYKQSETYVEKLTLENCTFDCDFKSFKIMFDPILLAPSERHEACALSD